MKKVAIIQSNYVPWKGYFDLIASVDEFVLLDDVQFTRRDWRNRNRIKTPQGVQWLTIPVSVKGRFDQSIRDTVISDRGWAARHWRSLVASYSRSSCFRSVSGFVEELYQADHVTLSSVNHAFIRSFCKFLQIPTVITDSSQYARTGDRNARLVSICQQAKADIYVSGPSARSYLDEAAFAEKDIGVEWFDYGNYPEYPQLWGDFVHEVSILDLVFNCGTEAPHYMKAGSRVGKRS